MVIESTYQGKHSILPTATSSHLKVTQGQDEEECRETAQSRRFSIDVEYVYLYPPHEQPMQMHHFILACQARKLNGQLLRVGMLESPTPHTTTKLVLVGVNR